MKTRVLSAALMVAIFIPFLLIGGLPFAIFMAVVSAFGLHELIKVRETRKKFPTVLKIIAYILVMVLCFTDLNTIEFQYNFDYKVMALIIFLFLTPIVFINDNEKYNINDALFLIGSILFIGLSFNLVIITRNFDINNKKSDTLRLGLSRITMEEIEEGIKIISECVNEIKK